MKHHSNSSEDGFMGLLFSVDKKEPSKTRKLPYLPRIGLYIDMAGYELIVKKVPFVETVVNLLGKGYSPRALAKIARQQLAEVEFPKLRKLRVVNTSARTISVDEVKR